MKSSKKRFLLVVLILLILSVFAFLCDKPEHTESIPQAKKQVFQTSLLLTEPPMDWGEIGKQGIAILVLFIVMLYVVSPLIKQIIESNNKLSEALSSLSSAISQGNSSIIKTVQDSERVVRNDISDLKEDLMQEIRKTP